MASLYRPAVFKPIPTNAIVRVIKGKSFACWTNRKNKKVEAELTEDGKRCRIESPTWWIKYTTAAGKPDRRKGFRDKAATLQLAATLERTADDVRSGREAPRAGPAGHMIDHVGDFRASLLRKGSSEGHIEHTVMQVTRVLKEAELTTPGAVDREKVERWLDGEQARLNWGARTRNQWAGSLNQFGRWLVKAKKANANPFDGLARQNVEANRRLVRRVLEPEDLDRLVAAAFASGVIFHGLSGPDRAMLYLVAAYTGRRVSALKRMTRLEIQFDADAIPIAVTTSARLQKSKKDHTVPLHPDIGRIFARWLVKAPEKGPLWVGWKLWADRGAELIQHDLKLAREKWIAEAGKGTAEEKKRERSDRLRYKDEAGEVFDFHALRGQFITSLAISGVPLTAAQELADHSDPKLTARVYTRWKNKLAPEVAKMPGPGVQLPFDDE